MYKSIEFDETCHLSVHRVVAMVTFLVPLKFNLNLNRAITVLNSTYSRRQAFKRRCSLEPRNLSYFILLYYKPASGTTFMVRQDTKCMKLPYWVWPFVCFPQCCLDSKAASLQDSSWGFFPAPNLVTSGIEHGASACTPPLSNCLFPEAHAMYVPCLLLISLNISADMFCCVTRVKPEGCFTTLGAMPRECTWRLSYRGGPGGFTPSILSPVEASLEGKSPQQRE